VLLVIADAMTLYQRHEILRGIARQCAFAKMRILRQKILRRRIDIGEVATTAAGNADFLRQLRGVVDQHHFLAALAATAAHIMPAAPAPITATSN